MNDAYIQPATITPSVQFFLLKDKQNLLLQLREAMAVHRPVRPYFLLGLNAAWLRLARPSLFGLVAGGGS
jgi:hypothetical protein